MKVSHAAHSHSLLVLSVFLILTIPMHMGWYLIVILKMLLFCNNSTFRKFCTSVRDSCYSLPRFTSEGYFTFFFIILSIFSVCADFFLNHLSVGEFMPPFRK